MTKTFNFNFNIIFSFLLGLILGLVIGSTPVYAYTYGDSDNDFENKINTLTEFTSLNSILADSAYSDSASYIKNFINNDECANVYLLSYYNSGADPARSYKSVDLFCVPSDIDFNPVVVVNENTFILHFTGEPGSTFTWRDHGSISGRTHVVELDSFGFRSITYSSPCIVRSIFDITNYYDFDQMLPNYFLSDSFDNTNFIGGLFDSVSSFGFYIALMVSLFIFLYIINKKLGLGLGFNYRGGAYD